MSADAVACIINGHALMDSQSASPSAASRTQALVILYVGDCFAGCLWQSREIGADARLGGHIGNLGGSSAPRLRFPVCARRWRSRSGE
jgi:hypothetical protein